MSIETDLAATLAAVTSIHSEVQRLADAVAELRRSVPPTLGSIQQAADVLHVSTRTVRRGIAAGDIAVRRVGRRTLVDLAALRPLTDNDVAALARDARSDQ